MNKGYSLEHEIENYFLELEGKTREEVVSNRSHRISFSGAMRGEKGDVVGHVPHLNISFLIECKSRYSKTKDDQKIYLEWDWLSKIEEEASAYKYIPLLIFSFKRKKQKRLWCVFKEDFLKNHSSIDLNKLSVMDGVARKNLIISYNIIKDFEIVRCSGLVFIDFFTFWKWLTYGVSK